MNTKRVLFVHENAAIGALYRDQLEHQGFSVEVTDNSATTLTAVATWQPSLIIADPLLPGRDGPELVRQILDIPQPAGRPQIFSLPTCHIPLATAMEKAGVDRVLERNADPLRTVLTEAVKYLGSDQSGVFCEASSLHLWRREITAAAPSALGEIGRTLQEVSRQPADPALMRQCVQQIHSFSDQSSLVGASATSQLAFAIEILVQSLEYSPDRINPGALRTVSQSLDFLQELLKSDKPAEPANRDTSQILIVEDEPMARELVTSAMDLVGLHADALETPEASLAVLATQQCDLIFLDVNLPEMTGFELCTKVRSLPYHRFTPIVFLTGMTTFNNRVQSSLSGGNDFVGKPFNLAELGVKALLWLLKGKHGLN